MPNSISFTGGNFKDNFIRKRNKAVYLSLGYNTWNLLVEFDLDSIYNQNIFMKNLILKLVDKNWLNFLYSIVI